MRFVMVGIILLLAGCTVSPTSAPQTPAPQTANTVKREPGAVRSSDSAVAVLRAVVERVEPVAESECRKRTQGVECNLSIFLDEDPRLPPNAFQTEKNGKPIIIFTMALARQAKNTDELAFILGHEAAHHIRGHIPQTQQTAVLGAVLAGVLAQAGGANASTISMAQDFGATVGSRAFSKDFELQADQLGTIIAARAGYDPVRGAQYFNRVPDPGDRFLGSHPPNADRIRIVRETASKL